MRDIKMQSGDQPSQLCSVLYWEKWQKYDIIPHLSTLTSLVMKWLADPALTLRMGGPDAAETQRWMSNGPTCNMMKSIIFMCEPVETHTSAQTLACPLFSFSVFSFYYPTFATLRLFILFIISTLESLCVFCLMPNMYHINVSGIMLHNLLPSLSTSKARTVNLFNIGSMLYINE